MSTEKISRSRRTFTREFKQGMIDLYRSSKRKCDIVREYDIANSLLDKWIFQAEKSELEANIVDIFRTSRNNYGTRKIKRALATKGFITSRRKIAIIMESNGLVSNYTVAQFRPQRDKSNETKVTNVLDRQFQDQPYRHVVVSDLTYVRVGSSWNYICVLVDLYNREIIGYSAGKHKTASLVQEAFQSVKESLCDIQIFHTDRGNEFKNTAIDETLTAFGIQRSLSHKGSPHDNAVAEATFKSMKTEFVRNHNFGGLKQLKLEPSDYVNWFNHHRLHSTLDYVTRVKNPCKINFLQGFDQIYSYSFILQPFNQLARFFIFLFDFCQQRV